MLCAAWLLFVIVTRYSFICMNVFTGFQCITLRVHWSISERIQKSRWHESKSSTSYVNGTRRTFRSFWNQITGRGIRCPTIKIRTYWIQVQQKKSFFYFKSNLKTSIVSHITPKAVTILKHKWFLSFFQIRSLVPRKGWIPTSESAIPTTQRNLQHGHSLQIHGPKDVYLVTFYTV